MTSRAVTRMVRDVYISKPFDPVALCYQIGNILRLVRNRQEKIVEGGKEAIEANKTLTQLDKDFVKSISDMVEVNLENANFSIDDITSSMGISQESLIYQDEEPHEYLYG